MLLWAGRTPLPWKRLTPHPHPVSQLSLTHARARSLGSAVDIVLSSVEERYELGDMIGVGHWATSRRCTAHGPPAASESTHSIALKQTKKRAPRTQVQLLVISYSLASFPDLKVFLSIPILAFFTARRPAPCPIARPRL